MFLFAVVLVGAGLFMIQQFSGINAVVFFSTAVFRGAGIKSDVAASALVGLANVIGVGRRLMLQKSCIHHKYSLFIINCSVLLQLVDGSLTVF